jgi:hypothetical protein
MPSIAFVAPILPGKSDTDRAHMASCDHGDRHAEYVASRRRAGITRGISLENGFPPPEQLLDFTA